MLETFGGKKSLFNLVCYFTSKKLGTVTIILKKNSCFILNSQFLNLKTTKPIYTILCLDDSSKPTKLVNHCKKNVSVATGIHTKKFVPYNNIINM